MAVKIAKGVYDVGVTDWNIRDFHGYSTYQGTTYNAFLVIDEKIALIDTVKKEFADQLLANIAEIVDPKKIDYVISNHTEMDHSGSLFRVMHRIGADKPIYCSKMGLKNLPQHFSHAMNYHPVVTGEKLNLGQRSLTFMETRMLHWPDSMFSYLSDDGLLFSSDAFGQHYAGYEKFDDQLPLHEAMFHAKKYFANILLLYAPRILKLLEQVAASGLQINMICPDHGLLWRAHADEIISAYGRWSRQEGTRKAVVVYDTMWHSTEQMAEDIVHGIAAENVAVRPLHIRSSHRSDIMTEVLEAKAVIVGSPTLNNQMFPAVADVLTYMKGLKPLNKIGAAFGSYGWSGEAAKFIREDMEAMNFDLPFADFRVKYVPDSQNRSDCVDFGRRIGRAVKDCVK